MASAPALTPGEILDYADIRREDRGDCLRLLQRETSEDARAVLGLLADRLGAGRDEPLTLVATEESWIAGLLHFTPELVRWHAEHGIADEVTRATLADFGRNLDINRRVHGRFGLDTFRWLMHHYAGRIYQLGRLQYLIHRGPEPAAAGGIPGSAPREWLLGIHIPESGGLAPDAVQTSIELAQPFFACHFPEQPVRMADCASWLLDPYIPGHLDPDSNIVRFARRFTPYGRPLDSPTDAVYFTFRTRAMADLADLPRRTALQRMVLDRIDDGGCWQLGFGYLELP